MSRQKVTQTQHVRQEKVPESGETTTAKKKNGVELDDGGPSRQFRRDQNLFYRDNQIMGGILLHLVWKENLGEDVENMYYRSY